MQVFEKRGDPETTPASSHRSVRIVLKKGTIKVLEEAGVELPSEEGVYRNGLVSFNGTLSLIANVS